jgi:hypothetical protein
MRSRNALMNDMSQSFVLLEDKGFFEQTSDLLYWPAKSFGFATILTQAAARDKDTLYFIEDYANHTKLVRVKPTFVSSFDSSMTGSKDTFVTGTWENADGSTTLNFSDGIQFKLYSDHIEKSRASEAFQEALQVTSLAANRFCIYHMSGLWLHDIQNGIFKKFVADEGTGRL